MQQKTKNKLLLCLQEMQYIKEIVDLQCTDDQTSRMLGLYVAMRMDDFIHMLPSLPDSNPNKYYIESGKQEYKNKLLDARNKLGAHFQSIAQEDTEDEKSLLYDLLERNRIFSSIDYSKITDLIDEAVIVYQIATHTEDHAPVFVHITEPDKAKIASICNANNRKGKLLVYNDYLHLSRPNSVGAVIVDEGQQKAQQLNSISMLISDVSRLYDTDYSDSTLKRMFKRMLVCWIVNFYDNLVTRPIPPTAPQYEPGLDTLLNKTFAHPRTRDTQDRIASYITEIQSLKNNQTILDNAREVRNKACAHLDGASDVGDINTIIDQFDADALRDQYELWHSIFKEILKSHSTLTPLLPLSQAEIYDAWTEKTDQADFYGNKIDGVSNASFTGSISIEEAMEAIKNTDSEKRPLAWEKIRRILFDANGHEYDSLCTQLSKLVRSGVTYLEMEAYSLLLHDASQGYPEKNQALLLRLWNQIKQMDPRSHKFILWPLTANAQFDKSDRLQGLIVELIESPQLWARLFGGLIAFHAEIQKTTSPFAYALNPTLGRDFLEIATAIPRDSIQGLILWLVVASHWHWDSSFLQPNWRAYRAHSEEISDRLKQNCETYCMTVNVNPETKECLVQLGDTHRYIELLWCLIMISRQTNDHTDDFLSLIENNLMVGNTQNNIETAYWALCHEELGLIPQAQEKLKRLVADNTHDKCLRLSYVKFLTRHPEYSQELEQQRKYLEDHFNLTEEDRKWMR